MAIIPFHTFGGDGALIHFAHGNGFSPACYQPFIDQLTDQNRIIGMASRPLWPNSEIDKMSGWRLLADDLTEFLGKRNLRHIIGMGHSVGAVTTAFTAANDPSFFKALILIEPTFFMPTQVAMFRMMPQNILKNQPLFKDALNRPNHWESIEDVEAYVATDPSYSTWDIEAKEQYIAQGFKKNGSGYQLAFSPEWETLIYRQAPRAWNALRNIEVPTLAIRGRNSEVMTDKAWERWQKQQPEATFVEIPNAGHWVTMEARNALSMQIKQFLANIA